MNEGRYYGKYRGTVLTNIDPEMRGRLLVQVPDVLNLIPSSWAEACVPLAGPTGPPMGLYVVPPVGAGVWVEFENGDPNYPIWVGCRWGSQSDIPGQAKAIIPPVQPPIILQTLGQNSITISDMPAIGGIILKTLAGASITVNDLGIIIDNGKGAKITMVGTMVDINNGGLTVLN